MYFVNEHKFDELLDAISCCKSIPTSTLIDDNGKVLMWHKPVSFETFRDIWMAQQILEYQLTNCKFDD
jgi:hypothetical protein